MICVGVRRLQLVKDDRRLLYRGQGLGRAPQRHEGFAENTQSHPYISGRALLSEDGQSLLQYGYGVPWPPQYLQIVGDEGQSDGEVPEVAVRESFSQLPVGRRGMLHHG